MTNKKVQKNQEICGIFDTLNEPEISTIALIQMTADAAKVSYDRVVQALSWRNKICIGTARLNGKGNSMYKLGQTLIFTSLTQASAAADLWGKDALDSAVKDEDYPLHEKDWHKGFSTSYVFDGWEKVLIEFNTWRIVLDTEEKLAWFTPKAYDVCFIFGKKEHPKTATMIFEDNGRFYFYATESEVASLMVNLELKDIKAIISRKTERSWKGKNLWLPFPTPQEVIEPCI